MIGQLLLLTREIEYNTQMSMIRKISATLLVFVMMLQFTGCGTFLDSLASQGITRFIDQVMDELIRSEGKLDLNIYSDRQYNMTDVLDERRELYEMMFSGVMYETGEPKVSADRNEGKCKVTFRNVPDLSSISLKQGTLNDYKAELRKAEETKVNVTFNVIRDEYGDWMFADLDDFFRRFLEPSEGFCFMDDDDRPINITADYVKSSVVDSVWYDPLMGNPMTESYLLSPVTLINVIYFDQPVDLTLTARLMKDNTEVREIVTDVISDTAVMFDFYSGGGENAAVVKPGRYHVELYYEGEKVYESGNLIVK